MVAKRILRYRGGDGRRGARVVALGLCLSLTACATPAKLRAPSPEGPTISGLEFVPSRTVEGCPVILRFHVDSARNERAPRVTAWILMARRDGRGARGSLRPKGSGLLTPRASGEATLSLTPRDPGWYRYYVQVEDEAGRRSNVLDAGIVIEQRFRQVSQVCP